MKQTRGSLGTVAISVKEICCSEQLDRLFGHARQEVAVHCSGVDRLSPIDPAAILGSRLEQIRFAKTPLYLSKGIGMRMPAERNLYLSLSNIYIYIYMYIWIIMLFLLALDPRSRSKAGRDPT